ncbi:putative necrosis-inducing factor domain-containing protein [Hirsutella rhossiliensis]|uniref:Necrosis-inducing factor domain-containing protein n=1 Tax=Hirsutella rhossiliensis TaxID=111463 RepID=A0A9P8SE21_9HYPO|nr:putative necrosis-inducing factor domain-containing protein [Hirsutella rhossiliensis]KAH0957591.1 putative necrosis-inducing factor domain-containing protein [Hirsutella rhossiliensis]
MSLLLVLLLALEPQVVVAAALAYGSPFTNATGISWRPSQAAQRTCGPITFAADPNLDPANWRQCAALYSHWTSENGTFGVANADHGPSYRPIVGQTDCALAVAPLASTTGPYLVGSKDIEAILQRSLRDFSYGSLLAVNGTVDCDVASGGRAPMSWKISKPDGVQ